MKHPARFWAGAFAALGLVDLWADRNNVTGDTLSECTRRAYRTHTTVGRVAFVASWVALSWWLVPHILKSAKDTFTS